MSKHSTSQRDINSRVRMNQALELRKSGATLDAIALSCGYGSKSTAHKAIRRAMAELPQENAKELRQLEVARLDELLLAWWPKAKLSLDAAHLVLKVSKRRSELLGLDISPDPTPPDVQIVVREVPMGFITGLNDEPSQEASNGHAPVLTQGV